MGRFLTANLCCPPPPRNPMKGGRAARAYFKNAFETASLNEWTCSFS